MRTSGFCVCVWMWICLQWSLSPVLNPLRKAQLHFKQSNLILFFPFFPHKTFLEQFTFSQQNWGKGRTLASTMSKIRSIVGFEQESDVLIV